MFEWTVSIDTVLAAGALAFGLWRAHAANIGRFAQLETKVDALWQAYTARKTR